MQIYLDCDGVLADFDKAAADVFGMSPQEYKRRYGLGKFWKRLAAAPDFFARAPLMPDAIELFRGVSHLDPVILTGCPRGGWAEAQKECWAAEHFPGTRIVTCMAVNKCRYCHTGDVLVDDTLKYRHLWEEAGGLFVHHRNARETLAELHRLLPEAFETRRSAAAAGA